MKKQLILTILLAFINLYTLKASNVSNIVDTLSKSTKESVQYIDTSSNFKMIYSDIKSGLQGLALGLKVGVEHVYDILVKQQVVNSIVYLLIFILAIICMIICYKQWDKIETDRDGDPEEIKPVAFTVVFGLLGLILMLIFVFNIDTMVMGFVNPEYGAIKEIINFVNK
jgi:hypothetical protein